MTDSASTAPGQLESDHRSVPEEIDTLVRVTTVHAWLALGMLFLLCAAAVVFAILYRVPKKVAGDGILLIKHDRLTQIRARDRTHRAAQRRSR